MKILFLTGPHAVGKSYFMQKLSENNNFFQFDTGPEMRKMHKNFEPNISIMEWVDELEKKYGPNITCDLLCKNLESKDRNTNNIIVTGFRQIEGIQYMIDYFMPDDYEILYIDAPFELLKSNYEYREKVEVTDESFLEYLKIEEEWGLANLKQYVLNGNDHCTYFMKNNNLDVISTDLFNETKVKKIIKEIK